MAKNDTSTAPQPGREGVISIIGPGMRVVGDCETEGTLRIEGTVEGTVRAGKAVVVGKEGIVDGDIFTQDAVVGGRVNGSVRAESRLELQATCVVEGKIQARRIKLEEGGTVNGTMEIGQVDSTEAKRGGSRERPGSPAPQGERPGDRPGERPGEASETKQEAGEASS